MTYLESYAPAMRANSFPVDSQPTEVLRQGVARTKQEPTSKVTDEAIVRTIGHLNDQQLDDIGICRKPRASSWRSLGRGIPPAEICKFDYFWLNI